MTPQVFGDERGWFMETYKASEFRAAGLPTDFVQDAMSRNRGAGVLRGLHLQRAPRRQGRLVRCTLGACFDVVVDARPESPTFGRWEGRVLSEEDKTALWVPPGFAHGYVTRTPTCDILYRFTAHEFSAAHYRSIRWDDPSIGIKWPVSNPVLSPKDAGAPTLAQLRPELG